MSHPLHIWLVTHHKWQPWRLLCGWNMDQQCSVTQCHTAAWTQAGPVMRHWVSADSESRGPDTEGRSLIGPAAGQSLHWRQATTQQATRGQMTRTAERPERQNIYGSLWIRDFWRKEIQISSPRWRQKCHLTSKLGKTLSCLFPKAPPYMVRSSKLIWWKHNSK